MTYYINRNGQGQRETVDEFNNRPEAVQALREYRMGDRSADYYLSRRACRGWMEG